MILGMRWSPARIAIVTCLVLAVGVAGRWVYVKVESLGTPSCSWPLRIRGPASGGQEGLVRCYMRALATRDTSLMSTVATNPPKSTITRADFRYSRDARSGMATATFSPNPSDSTDVDLEIRFADGVVEENLGLENEIAFGGPSAWRMTVGSAWGS
jgi:hypothetical protein